MRKPFGIILTVILTAPLVLGALCLLALHPWISSTSRLDELLAGERIEGLVRAELAGSADDAVHMADWTLSGKAMKAALNEAFAPGEIAKSIDEFRSGLWASLDAIGSPEPSNLDLGRLKAAMRVKAPALARGYVNALAENPELDLAAVLEQKDLRQRPAKGDLVPLVEQALLAGIEAIPDREVLHDPSLSTTFPAESGFRNLGDLRRLISTVILWFSLGTALVLVLVAILGSPHLHGRMGFLAAGLLPGGVLTSLIGLACLIIPPGMSWNGSWNMSASPELESLAREFAGTAATLMGRDFLLVGLTGTVLAAGLLIGRHFVRKAALGDLDEDL